MDKYANNKLRFNDDDTVSVTSSNGEKTNYVEVAGVIYNGGYYIMLKPIDLSDDFSKKNALICKLIRDNDDEYLEIELDHTIIDAVFKKLELILN